MMRSEKHIEKLEEKEVELIMRMQNTQAAKD